uniref:Secreted protein n=1 Tax=Rhabditophanes sp. KR3021 TaxID=114890 RepID=A0AC35U6F8_9BILA
MNKYCIVLLISLIFKFGLADTTPDPTPGSAVMRTIDEAEFNSTMYRLAGAVTALTNSSSVLSADFTEFQNVTTLALQDVESVVTPLVASINGYATETSSLLSNVNTAKNLANNITDSLNCFLLGSKPSASC